MKSSLWKLAAILAIGIAAVCSPVISMAYAVHRTVKRAKDWLVDTISFGFKLAGNGGGSSCGPAAVMLVQAKAFVLRLAKRERPELTSSWRMCPSC